MAVRLPLWIIWKFDLRRIESLKRSYSAAFFLLIAALLSGFAQTSRLYEDPSALMDRRVDDLLSRMMLEETYAPFMTVRFQADNDLDQRIVKATRQFDPSVDFQTAFQAKLHGRADPLVLQIAASENRILVSRDRRSMPGHAPLLFPFRKSASSGPAPSVSEPLCSRPQLSLVSTWRLHYFTRHATSSSESTASPRGASHEHVRRRI